MSGGALGPGNLRACPDREAQRGSMEPQHPGWERRGKELAGSRETSWGGRRERRLGLRASRKREAAGRCCGAVGDGDRLQLPTDLVTWMEVTGDLLENLVGGVGWKSDCRGTRERAGGSRPSLREARGRSGGWACEEVGPRACSSAQVGRPRGTGTEGGPQPLFWGQLGWGCCGNAARLTESPQGPWSQAGGRGRARGPQNPG